MRLDKYLAHANAGSRKEVKLMIRKGFVKINGEVCKKDDVHVDETKDHITLFDEEIGYQKYVYIMLNKPQGCVSATVDSMHPTVMDYLDVNLPRDMFPVGRLDIDTQGLLLLCNDGALSHTLLSPKHHVEKEYEVILDTPIREEEIRLLESGTIRLDEEAVFPAKVKVLEPNHIHLIISQGKFHQIKRMIHAVHHEVLSLKRLRMGSLWLDETLKPGEWRYLSEEEVKQLQSHD